MLRTDTDGYIEKPVIEDDQNEQMDEEFESSSIQVEAPIIFNQDKLFYQEYYRQIIRPKEEEDNI